MIISDFDLTVPKEDDPLSIADEELRSIKTALVSTFKHFDSPFTIKFSDFNKFNTTISINGTTKLVKLGTSKYTPMVDSKRLYVDNAGTVIYSNPLPPLGSIIKTIMTLDQLNTIYGVGVFLMLDGSSTIPAGIPMNIYKATPTDPMDKVANISITPVDKEKFTYWIRQAKTEQDIDYTPIPSAIGIPIGGTSTTTALHSHTHTSIHTHNLQNIYKDAINDARNEAVSDHLLNTPEDYTTSNPIEDDSAVAKPWTGYSPAHTHTVTLTGDPETRPKNISLNFYIRVM